MKRWFFAFAFLLILASCAEAPKKEEMSLSPVGFDDLAGWNNDHQAEAIPAFVRSCAKLVNKSSVHDWRPACAALTANPPQDDASARTYFERYFTPFTVNDGDENGLFTGYYEAQLNGSLQRTAPYIVPLYMHPDDLISVDLGLFKSDLKGQKIVGKVDQLKLIPYDERAQIARNSLNGRAKVLVWVDDPITAFFLEIQGSGQVKLPDGQMMRIGFDATNGRPYAAIGKALADSGEVEKPVTMQKIRNWLASHPDRAQQMMDVNASYIFFRPIEGEGPIGAQGVALTPQRSMAVDPSFVQLGSPLWLDLNNPQTLPMHRLMIAQDTGGAIKGPIRGDFFWGAGQQAEASAGNMQSRGRYFVLLPKSNGG